MFIASIVGASIFIAAMICVAVFLHSYNIYTRNRLFIKAKLSILLIVLGAIIIAGLLGFAIFLTIQSTKSIENPKQYLIQAILIYVLTALALGDYIAYIIITKLNNKNKINYIDIEKIDWEKKIQDIKSKVDIEALKKKLAKKSKSYFENMMNSYQEILLKAKNKDLKMCDKVADIVLFNENFTHKWSTYNNNFQLLLTYEFCKIFKK